MTVLGVQAWVGSAAPEPSRLVKPYGDHTKPTGGLWTSTWDEDAGSGWTRWCDEEQFRGPQHEVWLLTPDPEARVYTVDNYTHLERLHRMYGVAPLDYPTLRWEYIAERYDAVHLTEDGQWRTRLTRPYSLYGWDCESTVWLRWSFTAVERYGLWSSQRRQVTA